MISPHDRSSLLAGFIVILLGLMLSDSAFAHNNPSFREDLILTIPVSATPKDNGAYSDTFAIDWPQKTVQLIWRIKNPAVKATFAVARDTVKQIEDIRHDTTSKRLQGNGFTIVDMSGSKTPFTIELYAKVLERKKK